MSVVVWAMVAIAFWHFAVLVPDRFWGGIVGALLANFLGTTGASMLLIRPFLRMNRGHIRPYHVVFFIFVVSNAGGLLTPIGDPPLFPRHQEVELSWKILDPIEEYWTSLGQPEQYKPGTWGPPSADELLARDGRVWRRP